MILDTSAVVSMVEEEEGCGVLLDAVASAPVVAIGAPTLFEAGMILVSREGLLGYSALSLFIAENEVASIPFSDRHRAVALDAFIRYGKGRHPARLNFGDCMAYATAHLANLPLLFVGEDFVQTDLTLVPIPPRAAAAKGSSRPRGRARPGGTSGGPAGPRAS